MDAGCVKALNLWSSKLRDCENKLLKPDLFIYLFASPVSARSTSK